MIQSFLLLTTLPVYAIIVMSILLSPERHNFTKAKITQLIILIVCSLLINLAVIKLFGLPIYRKLYFILMQAPVFAGFRIISDYSLSKILFTLITTILLSGIPVEAVIISRVLSNGKASWILAGLMLSFVFAYFLVVRLLKPNYQYMLKYGEPAVFWKFSIIPFLYYFYSYISSGYNFTQYYSLDNFFLGRIPELIVFVSYFLIIDVYKKTHETELLKNRERLMLMELDMAAEQINLLRSAEKQSAIHRHDLRHHLNYLYRCIDTNSSAEASSYITEIFKEMDHVKVNRYCRNESVNLILASYDAKAKENNINVTFEISDVDFSRFQIIDICSLVSNALENALEACKQIRSENERSVRLCIYEKNAKFCMNISNNYASPPVLENGVPIASEAEHGIGTVSMIHVVEKYKGVYGFHAENGKFTFQASM